jgi:Skp family chaperone for outer membrane proteins
MNRALTALLFVSSWFLSAVSAVAQGSSPAAPAIESKPAPLATKLEAPKIGIVDFVKVVDAYPRAIAERQKIDELRKQQLTILDAEIKKAREMQLKLSDLQRGTSARDLKEHELRLKEQDVDGMKTLFEREWRRKVEEFYTSIYADLERAVSIVAKDRGVQLVLRAHPELEDGSTESKARVFEARIVWYSAQELDLTAAVIALLQVPLPPDPKAGAGDPKAGAGVEKGSTSGAKTDTAGG